jgi:hypothetical protein
VSNEHQSPLDQAMDLFVYAPLGLACFAKDTVPTFLKMFVARGQTEIQSRQKRAKEQANQYKVVGQMAVKYGGPEVKRQADAKIGEVRRRAEETFGAVVSAMPAPPPSATGPRLVPEPAPAPAAAAAPAPVGEPSASAVAVDHTPEAPPAPAVETLAIPDYDELSASQVVERLDGLGKAELDAVDAYESAHRGRRTILGKIEQLRA